MNTLKFVVVLLTLIVVSLECGAVQAQPVQAAKKVLVHPRALINQVEIAEYRHAVNAAPTREAKQLIRENTYARLRLRAAARGMVMAEPHPWYGGLHWGEMGYQTNQNGKTSVPEAKPQPVSNAVPATTHATPSASVLRVGTSIAHTAPAPASHAPAKPVLPPRAP